MNVNQNAAVFSLLGTTFGGNGATTFFLPDLRGRTMIGVGQSLISGSSNFVLGAMGGAEAASIGLTANNIPIHTHTATFAPTSGSQNVTIPAVPANAGTPPTITSATLQANISNLNNSPTVSSTNSFLASTPAGGGSANIWATAAGATPVNVGGLSVTLNPGTSGSAAIPATTVPITTVTGGSVTVSPTGPTTQTPLSVKTMPPFLALNFIICLNGIYPTQQ